MDDLFGDEADIDVVAAEGVASQELLESKTIDEEPNSDALDNDLFGDAGFIEDDTGPESAHFHEAEGTEVEDEKVVTKFTIANHKKPTGDTEALYLAKLPSFLDVNSFPYDPESLLAEIQQSTEESADNDEKMTKKRSLVNTLRWKYQQDKEGEYKRVSNARFVRWSDGSMSLQVGEELFDVPVKTMNKEHNYLTLMHAEEGLLRGMQKFSHSITFQPFGLFSKSHAELKADIARRAITSKSRTVKLHTELIDPAELQKQAIKADNEAQKARRRLDSQKARAMNYGASGRDRTQLTAGYLDDSDEELGGGGQRYADENDDGFIEDDEEDETANRARLQALKDASAAQYKSKAKRARTDSDDLEESEDESVVYEDNAGEDSEEEAVMTPKGSPAREPEPEPESNKPKKLKRRIYDSDDSEDQ